MQEDGPETDGPRKLFRRAKPSPNHELSAAAVKQRLVHAYPGPSLAQPQLPGPEKTHSEDLDLFDQSSPASSTEESFSYFIQGDSIVGNNWPGHIPDPRARPVGASGSASGGLLSIPDDALLERDSSTAIAQAHEIFPQQQTLRLTRTKSMSPEPSPVPEGYNFEDVRTLDTPLDNYPIMLLNPDFSPMSAVTEMMVDPLTGARSACGTPSSAYSPISSVSRASYFSHESQLVPLMGGRMDSVGDHRRVVMCEEPLFPSMYAAPHLVSDGKGRSRRRPQLLQAAEAMLGDMPLVSAPVRTTSPRGASPRMSPRTSPRMHPAGLSRSQEAGPPGRHLRRQDTPNTFHSPEDQRQHAASPRGRTASHSPRHIIDAADTPPITSLSPAGGAPANMFSPRRPNVFSPRTSSEAGPGLRTPYDAPRRSRHTSPDASREGLPTRDAFLPLSPSPRPGASKTSPRTGDYKMSPRRPSPQRSSSASPDRAKSLVLHTSPSPGKKSPAAYGKHQRMSSADWEAAQERARNAEQRMATITALIQAQQMRQKRTHVRHALLDGLDAIEHICTNKLSTISQESLMLTSGALSMMEEWQEDATRLQAGIINRVWDSECPTPRTGQVKRPAVPGLTLKDMRRRNAHKRSSSKGVRVTSNGWNSPAKHKSSHGGSKGGSAKKSGSRPGKHYGTPDPRLLSSASELDTNRSHRRSASAPVLRHNHTSSGGSTQYKTPSPRKPQRTADQEEGLRTGESVRSFGSQISAESQQRRPRVVSVDRHSVDSFDSLLFTDEDRSLRGPGKHASPYRAGLKHGRDPKYLRNNSFDFEDDTRSQSSFSQVLDTFNSVSDITASVHSIHLNSWQRPLDVGSYRTNDALLSKDANDAALVVRTSSHPVSAKKEELTVGVASPVAVTSPLGVLSPFSVASSTNSATRRAREGILKKQQNSEATSGGSAATPDAASLSAHKAGSVHRSGLSVSFAEPLSPTLQAEQGASAVEQEREKGGGKGKEDKNASKQDAGKQGKDAAPPARQLSSKFAAALALLDEATTDLSKRAQARKSGQPMEDVVDSFHPSKAQKDGMDPGVERSTQSASSVASQNAANAGYALPVVHIEAGQTGILKAHPGMGAGEGDNMKVAAGKNSSFSSQGSKHHGMLSPQSVHSRKSDTFDTYMRPDQQMRSSSTGKCRVQ